MHQTEMRIWVGKWEPESLTQDMLMGLVWVCLCVPQVQGSDGGWLAVQEGKASTK